MCCFRSLSSQEVELELDLRKLAAEVLLPLIPPSMNAKLIYTEFNSLHDPALPPS